MKTSEFSRKKSCFLPSSLLCIVMLMTGGDLTGFGTRASASLLGYWQFEEGSGITTVDASGNGLTGTLTGTPLPTWVTPGQVGSGALEFPGNANTRVSLGNPALLQLTGPLTVAAWAFADTVTGAGRIITKGGNANFRGWSLGVESTGIWRLQIPSGANALTSCSTDPGTVALGTWTHVAGVYNPSDLTMKLYINGALATTTLNAAVPAAMYNPATIGVGIGARSDGTTRWDGKLDEVRIYDEALNAEQVIALVPEPSTLVIFVASVAMSGLRRFVRVRRETI